MYKVKAEVEWINKKLGGRIPPPKGTRFSPIIVFKNVNMNEKWSCDFVCTPVVDNKMIVKLGFLSEDAPNEFLESGNEFELFEGKRKVADGKIFE